jgi:hypothetical protein
MPLGIEDSVTQNFNRAMEDIARRRQRNIHPFPLNGQDRDAAGDSIFTDEMHFTLVEFKSREANLIEENRKPKRLKLCQLLPLSDEMKARHDRCHFAAWLASNEHITLNIYRHEICNQLIFPHARDLPESKDVNDRQRISQFGARFFDNDAVGLPIDEFEAYLSWVMEMTSDSGTSTVQVQAQDPTDYRVKSFSSLRKAYEWLHREPKPVLSKDYGFK